MDDFALFADNKALLWEWKTALKSRLAALRLTIHEHKAQVLPTVNGVSWLGFVVCPGYRKVKARKVRHATRRLQERYHAYCNGQISFAEFDASVQGWINHVRFAEKKFTRRCAALSVNSKPARQRSAASAVRYSMGDEHNTRNPILKPRLTGGA